MKAHKGHILPVRQPALQPEPASGIPSAPTNLVGAGDPVSMFPSDNTRRAYASDWKHFAAWCRRQNVAPLPLEPQIVARYLTGCASGSLTGGKRPNSASTIERRLSSLSWNYAQRGEPLDRNHNQIATAMAQIRNSPAKPIVQKQAVSQEDIIAMLETLDRGSLRGIRDRAMLLIGFAGRLRRSEIVGLDVSKDQTDDSRGWVEIVEAGLLVTLRGRRRLHFVEIGRGSTETTCPVAALETWLKFSRITHGPLFRRVTGRGKLVGSQRLNDQEVARLVKRTALAAGMLSDLTEHERALKFAGHSLRVNLPASTDPDEGRVFT